MRCRQPEKILFPLELTVLFAQPVEFSALVALQLAMIGGWEVASINAGWRTHLARVRWARPVVGQQPYR